MAVGLKRGPGQSQMTRAAGRAIAVSYNRLRQERSHFFRRKDSAMADARAALEELLHSLGESAQFVASGEMPATLPGLEVDGVGMVGTPVSAADAKRLIAQAAQAPYGRGEETIVDTDVRRVWQIEPDAFCLR